MLNHTHRPEALSWVTSANTDGQDFPVQNLPIAIMRRAGTSELFRGGIAIGDQALDLAALLDTNVIPQDQRPVFELAAQPSLNQLMAAGQASWTALRHTVFALLEQSASTTTQAAVSTCLIDRKELEFAVPSTIGDYTDFYTSFYHADNIAGIAGVNGPRGTNFEWLPIAYHGRASSVVISGTSFKRPHGQVKGPSEKTPRFSICTRLDYELELGVFVGPGNTLGQPISIEKCEEHIFGICLLNDWSARDIQFWEMAPLGPFLGKNFCTSISPWIVMREALVPFRQTFARDTSFPAPLPYLDSPFNREQGALDIRLTVALSTALQRQRGIAPTTVSSTSFKHQHWTIGQMITQHTVNGCNLQSGDLIGTGTISGPTAQEAGAIIELARAGTTPLPLDGGEQRSFIEDGDRVIFSGWCEAPGARRIGFGQLWGEVC